MKTEMEISEIGNEKLGVAILQGMEMRVKANKLKEESDALKEEANELLEPMLEVIGASKISCGLGSVSMYTTIRTKLNTSKFKEALALKGVDSLLIASTERNNTKTTESSSLRFTPKKEK